MKKIGVLQSALLVVLSVLLLSSFVDAAIPAYVGSDATSNFLSLSWLSDVGLLEAPVAAPVGFLVLLVLGIMGVAAYGLCERGLKIPAGYAFIIAFAVVGLSWVLMPIGILTTAAAEYVTLFSAVLIGLPFGLLFMAYWFFSEHPWVRAVIMILIAAMWFYGHNGIGVAEDSEVKTFLEGTLFSWTAGIGFIGFALYSVFSAVSSHAKGGVNENRSLAGGAAKLGEGWKGFLGKKDAGARAAVAGASKKEVEEVEEEEEEIEEEEEAEEKSLLDLYIEETKETEFLKKIDGLLSEEVLDKVFVPTLRGVRANYIDTKAINKYYDDLIKAVNSASREVGNGRFISGRLVRRTQKQFNTAKLLLDKLLLDGVINQAQYSWAQSGEGQILVDHRYISSSLDWLLKFSKNEKTEFNFNFRKTLGAEPGASEGSIKYLDEMFKQHFIDYKNGDQWFNTLRSENHANDVIRGLEAFLKGLNK